MTIPVDAGLLVQGAAPVAQGYLAQAAANRDNNMFAPYLEAIKAKQDMANDQIKTNAYRMQAEAQMAKVQQESDPNSLDNQYKMAQINNLINKPLTPEGQRGYDMARGFIPENMDQNALLVNPNLPGSDLAKSASQLAFRSPKIAEAKGKAEVQQLTDDITTLQTNSQFLSQSEAAKQAAKDFNWTGTLGGAVQLGARVGASLTGNKFLEDKAAAGGLVEKFGNQLALFLRKEMPGQLSDKDVEFLKRTSSTLRDTPEAYNKSITAAQARAAYSNQYINMKQQWFSQYGTLDGFTTAWTDYAKQNPMAIKVDGKNEIHIPTQNELASYLHTGKVDTSTMIPSTGVPALTDADAERIAKARNMSPDAVRKAYNDRVSLYLKQ